MPEIGEVARVVHYIRKHLVNKTLSKVTANNDDIVYGKVGTSAAEFQKHVTGKKVVDAGQQGKYFWMIMSSPPHPVMHLGMSGWFKFKSEHTYYYRKKENEEADEWPPKYVKFLLEAKGDKDKDTQEAAFVDARRLARIRLVDCDGKDIRKHTPLKENGPDPVIDKDLVSLEWLTQKCNKKKVPIKAMLLDQAVISGIGNWVGDEIMYNAKMHPEQYANTLQDSQIKQLHKSIHYVCGTACELLADSEQFPEDWLFKHRWGKGKKSSTKTLPNGNKIEFLTVGGRTSAIVPAVQKKTGPVAADVDDNVKDETSQAEEDEEEENPKKAKKSATKKRKADEVAEKKAPAKKGKPNGVKAEEPAVSNGTETKPAAKKGRKSQEVKAEEAEVVEEPKPAVRGKKTKEAKSEPKKAVAAVKETATGKKAAPKKENVSTAEAEDGGRRRSGRLAKT